MYKHVLNPKKFSLFFASIFENPTTIFKVLILSTWRLRRVWRHFLTLVSILIVLMALISLVGRENYSFSLLVLKWHMFLIQNWNHFQNQKKMIHKLLRLQGKGVKMMSWYVRVIYLIHFSDRLYDLYNSMTTSVEI